MSYTADATELAIKNEMRRRESEQEQYDAAWKALLKAWGQYHRRAWKNRQGYPKGLLNFQNDTPYTNAELEIHLERISKAYAYIKDADDYTALLIIRLFVRRMALEKICLLYGWDKNRWEKRRNTASDTLRAIYNVIQ